MMGPLRMAAQSMRTHSGGRGWRALVFRYAPDGTGSRPINYPGLRRDLTRGTGLAQATYLPGVCMGKVVAAERVALSRDG